jgi:hypothetical protein
MHEKHSAVSHVVINDYQSRNSRPRETEVFLLPTLLYQRYGSFLPPSLLHLTD